MKRRRFTFPLRKQLSHHARSHWLIGVCNFRFALIFKKYFIKAIEHFFRVYIASSKHLEGWENSRKLCKPKT